MPALTLGITSPLDGATVNSQPIAVSGSVSNNASVTVNGIQAAVNGGLFTASIPLSEGPNTITAQALDPYGQNASDSISVTLVYLPPTVSLSAAPDSIMVGETAVLTWDSTDADTVSIDQDIGDVGLSGSMDVSPTETTTYTITATGPGGTAVDSITVTVTHPLPTVSLSADPGTIMVGETAALTWDSTDADTVSIDQGIGDVGLSGSMDVSPQRPPPTLSRLPDREARPWTASPSP